MTINSELDASKIVAVLANITSPEIERACSILYCRKGKHETPVPVITPDKQNGVNKQEKRVCGDGFHSRAMGNVHHLLRITTILETPRSGSLFTFEPHARSR